MTNRSVDFKKSKTKSIKHSSHSINTLVSFYTNNNAICYIDRLEKHCHAIKYTDSTIHFD